MARATVAIQQSGDVRRSPISTRVEVVADPASVGFWTGQGGVPESKVERIVRRHAERAAREVAELTRDEMRRLTPKRSGAAQRSIHIGRGEAQGGLEGRYIITVGSDSDVVRWLDEGTGIYGPRHRPIVPISAKKLRFPNRGTGAFTNKGTIRTPVQRSLYNTSLQGGRPGSAGQRRAMARATNRMYTYKDSVAGIKPMHIVDRTVRRMRPIALARFRAAARAAAKEIRGL